MNKYEVVKSDRPGSDSYWIVETATGKRKMGPFVSKERAESICAGYSYNGRKA